MTEVGISIIVVCYNSNDLIVDCLNSVYKYNDLPDGKLEVILVDNSEKEGFHSLRELLKKNGFHDVVAHHNESNVGYGGGNNVGIRLAKNKIVLVVNPDVRFIVPVLKKIVESFFVEPGLAMLGGKQIGGNNISFYRTPEKFVPVLNYFMLRLNNKFGWFDPERYSLSGAFTAFDKEKFIKAGLYDENIFLYSEEPDITKRLVRNGYSVFYDKSIPYIHLVGDRRGFSENTFYIQLESKKYYFNKYGYDFDLFLRKVVFELYFLYIVSWIKRDRSRFESVRKTLQAYKSVGKC